MNFQYVKTELSYDADFCIWVPIEIANWFSHFKCNCLLRNIKYLRNGLIFRIHFFVGQLTLSWRRSLSYRNQSNGVLRNSMDWFLYDNGLRHERVKYHDLNLLIMFWSLMSFGSLCTCLARVLWKQDSFFLIFRIKLEDQKVEKLTGRDLLGNMRFWFCWKKVIQNEPKIVLLKVKSFCYQ